MLEPERTLEHSCSTQATHRYCQTGHLFFDLRLTGSMSRRLVPLRRTPQDSGGAGAIKRACWHLPARTPGSAIPNDLHDAPATGSYDCGSGRGELNSTGEAAAGTSGLPPRQATVRQPQIGQIQALAPWTWPGTAPSSWEAGKGRLDFIQRIRQQDLSPVLGERLVSV